jgi:hypothetical protein
MTAVASQGARAASQGIEIATEAPAWMPVDQHPAVRRADNPTGILSRDQIYRAAREGRCRALWPSSRRLLVHRDLLDDLAKAGRP